MSLSGAYVKTTTLIPPLTHVCVELQKVCSSRGARYRIQACVTRIDEGGLGLEWCDPSPSLIRELLTDATGFLAHYSTSDSAALNRAATS
jgi:hypothetical protein